MSAPTTSLVPRRFRNWVIFWTIMIWIVLELLTYPKTVPVTSGFSAVIKGFFSESVGAYPPWLLILVAICLFVAGIIGLVRRGKAVTFNVLLLLEGVLFVAWAVLAGGGLGGWAAGENVIAYNWAIQTVAVVLGGVAVYFWAAGNPERAELTTWNTHQVWKLYRGNWQGMVGLGILVVFLAMALLAPFLADPNAVQQGFLSSEPYSIAQVLGRPPEVLLIADAGFSAYQTTIAISARMAAQKKDLVQRFVDASLKGWAQYLVGGPATDAANALIKKHNPDQTDDRIAYAIKVLNERGIVLSGDALRDGIGAMSAQRWQGFYDSMVDVGVLPQGLDVARAYALEFVNKGIGKPA